MIQLLHKIDLVDEGVDIINPAHIVNIMSNSIEAPQAVVEYVTHQSDVRFKTHDDRIAFLKAVVGGGSVTLTIKSLSNTPSRWKKGE